MVEKSDAMKMHEQWINEVVAHKPKHSARGFRYDVRNWILAVVVILVIVVAAVSITGI